jgi:hypothetical protein
MGFRAIPTGAVRVPVVDFFGRSKNESEVLFFSRRTLVLAIDNDINEPLLSQRQKSYYGD